MRTVFADTFYWIALLNSKEQWHQRATDVKAEIGAAQIITTESVLIELLNYFCAYGPTMRRMVAKATRTLLDSSELEVLPHTSETFLSGLALYEARLDKGYSLTDCISMDVMSQRGVSEVLTHDAHFAQEGFILLL
ncbi:MAG: PIN domain-containing protein [Pyrinomonadaceae bacterium]